MKVSVCDMTDFDFETKLLKSVRETGFVVLTHHGIDYGLIKEAQHAWLQFFLENLTIKNMFVNLQNGNLGYKKMGTETAVGSKIPDLKEFFHWKPGSSCPGTAKAITEQMYTQLEDVSQQVLTVLARFSGANYQDQCYKSDNTLFRSLYYPAMENMANVEKGAVRAAAHEDINHITMLVAASAPGLEVKDVNGNWHSVPHEENSITVNIGDMLQLNSGGTFKSTTHRVVNASKENTDRLSMPLFVHPTSDTELQPGYTAGQFLKERIAQLYGKK